MKGVVLSSFLLTLSLIQGHLSDSFVQVPCHTSEGQKRQGVGQICDNYDTVSFGIALSTTCTDPLLVIGTVLFPHMETPVSMILEAKFSAAEQGCILFFEQLYLFCTKQCLHN